MDFYNVHSSEFIYTPLSYWLLKRKPHLKYEYLAKFKPDEARFIFDLKESSFFSKTVISKYFIVLLPLLCAEVLIWCWLNKIPLRNIRFVSKRFKVRKSKLFVLTYKSLVDVDDSTIDLFNKYKCVYAHLSHYMIRTAEKVGNLLKIKTCVTLLGDSDFTRNPYYIKYFGQGRFSFEILPFRPGDRFCLNVSSHKRENRVFSGGTIHNLELEKPAAFYEDFREFFRVNAYHTVRPYLIDKQLDFLDIDQGKWTEQAKSPNGGDYFKRDLVETFNRYRAVIYGSELSGAPSISNFEAICCGAIAFIDREYIAGLPLIEGVDFLHINEHSDDIGEELARRLKALDEMGANQKNEVSFRERFDFFLNEKMKKIFE